MAGRAAPASHRRCGRRPSVASQQRPDAALLVAPGADRAAWRAAVASPPASSISASPNPLWRNRSVRADAGRS